MTIDVKSAVAEVVKETGFVDPNPTPALEPVKEAAPATPAAPVVPVAGEEKVPGETPKVEEKLEVKAPETGKETEIPAAGDENDIRVTAEELELINKDPNLKRVYRSMVRGFTEKTSEFASTRKEAEAALAAVRSIRDDPKKAVMALAAATGLKVVDAEGGTVKEVVPPVVTEKTAVDKARELLTDKLGKEAADALGPVLVEAVKILAGEELSPIKKAFAVQDENAGKLALKSAVGDFGASVAASGGQWDETVEQEMADLVGHIVPGPNTPLPDFLKVLHNHVIANRTEKSTAGRTLVRLRAAAGTKEPVNPARPAPVPTAGAITAGMDAKTAIGIAIAAARQELGVR